MNSKKISIKMQLVLDTIPMLFILVMGIVSMGDFFNHQYSKSISTVLWILYILFGLTLLRKKDIIDEFAEKILGKTDKVCIGVIKIIFIILIVLICTPYSLREVPLNRDYVLLSISITLVLITILRAVLFSYYERKGI